MPNGKPYTPQERELIVYHAAKGADWIFDNVFRKDATRASISYLEKVVQQLRTKTYAEQELYLLGAKPQPPRPEKRKITRVYAEELIERREAQNGISYKRIAAEFNSDHFNVTADYISRSTIYNYLHVKERYTTKKLERRNINADPEEQYLFSNELAPLDPRRLKDIDAMSMAPSGFEQTYGAAPAERVAVKQQITIGSHSFSVLVMMGVDEVEAVMVHEGTIDADIFCSFINNFVAPVLLSGEIGILDNASIHKTARSKQALHDAFSGHYTYCSPYSPHLKPIEKIFALVKQYIRENEQAALADPLAWINRAFDMFRHGGRRAHLVRPMWNQYFRRHENYLLLLN